MTLRPRPVAVATAVALMLTPAFTALAHSTPTNSTPADSTPAEWTPAHSTPADSTPADWTPAQSTQTVRAADPGVAAVTEEQSRGVRLSVAGTYETGVFDESAAEITAFDPQTGRLFVVNADPGTVVILDTSAVLDGETGAAALLDADHRGRGRCRRQHPPRVSREARVYLTRRVGSG